MTSLNKKIFTDFFSASLRVGFLFLILYPASASPASARHLCHTPSFTHHFVTHHLSHTTLSHTTLSPTIFHTQLCHTPLCNPPSFTHNFVTHHLSHTTLSPTIFHTQLCHTPSFTHHLCHTPSFTQHLSHTTLSHTIFHTQLCHTPSLTHHFVTHHLSHHFVTHTHHLSHTIFLTLLCHPPSFTHHLSHTIFHTALSHAIFHTPSLTQHLSHTLFVKRGRRGTWRHPPSFCGAGVALGDIHLRFMWQAWHLLTFTCVWRGRCGTCCTWWRAPLVARGAASLCVASVALGDIHLRFTWQAWHLETSTFVLRGRRGTWRHPPSFMWQAWHLWTLATLSGVALVALGVARGAVPLCMAGMALRDMHLRFTWQAWLLETSTLRGMRGAWRHPPSFRVASATLGDIHLRFAWQAWHLGRWAGSGGALGLDWSPVTPRHFAWQAWRLVTSIFVSRGRRGTWRHPPSFCHTPSLSRATLSHTIFHTPSLTHHL